MSVQIVSTMIGETGTTFQITASDTAKALVHADNLNGLLDAEGKLYTSCLITCETFNIKFTFNSTPVSSGLGHILYVGQSLTIDNPKALRDLKYINATAGSNGVLMVTPILRPE